MATPLSTVLEPAALERVRAELEALDGVRRAVIDGPPYVVWVVAERSAPADTEMLAYSVLSRAGVSAPEAQVQVAQLPAAEPRRRVRFVAAHVGGRGPGRALASVQLEWAGETFEAELEGESGPALELRLAAMATLQALDDVLHRRVKFQLVGIKPFRAFDADVVVALLRSDLDGKSLIGAALAADDPYRAASVAVLNATNRVLGNYLSNDELAGAAG